MLGALPEVLAPAPAISPPAPPSITSRSVMNVCSIEPSTPTISSPVMNRTMSMMWALRSPWAPEPATSPWKRHSNGVSGPPQLCR